MTNIIRSPQAERDLDSIGDYIAKRSDSLDSDVRQFPVKAYNYVVYFRPVSDGIELVRVLHGSRDVPNVFHLPE